MTSVTMDSRLASAEQAIWLLQEAANKTIKLREAANADVDAFYLMWAGALAMAGECTAGLCLSPSHRVAQVR